MLISLSGHGHPRAPCAPEEAVVPSIRCYLAESVASDVGKHSGRIGREVKQRESSKPVGSLPEIGLLGVSTMQFGQHKSSRTAVVKNLTSPIALVVPPLTWQNASSWFLAGLQKLRTLFSVTRLCSSTRMFQQNILLFYSPSTQYRNCLSPASPACGMSLCPIDGLTIP